MSRIHPSAYRCAHPVRRTLAAAALIAAATFCIPPLAAAQAPLSASGTGTGPSCAGLDAVPAAVLDAPFLVFGEVHGTREVPAFVTTYLCTAARAGRRITLALEYPSGQQDALDVFMASAGTARDVERFTGTAFWRRERQDGRTSAAMLRMVESVRALRAGGADVRLVAIDGDGAAAGRDALMAGNVRTELDRLDGNPGRQVLVLIGGLHAVRTKGNRFNPHYESAVYQLADKRPLALTVGTSGGTAWVCQGGAPASCRETAWDINRVAPARATAFSLLPPSAQFDGVFFVGATTASPPAVRQDDLQGSLIR